MKLNYSFLLIIACIIGSCTFKPAPKTLNEESYNRYLENGSKLSAQSQSALLSHVSDAMKQGGSVYAVEFCNLKASGITDSLNNLCNCVISRVSDKNRNPENQLSTETEKQLWNYFQTIHETRMIHDTVVAEGKRVVYYKPILTAMPTCLQCHGPETEIDPATLSRIVELYPDDKATGYEMNELRGMWKISFPAEEDKK
jgi:hypothetical protein